MSVCGTIIVDGGDPRHVRRFRRIRTSWWGVVAEHLGAQGQQLVAPVLGDSRRLGSDTTTILICTCATAMEAICKRYGDAQLAAEREASEKSVPHLAVGFTLGERPQPKSTPCASGSSAE